MTRAKLPSIGARTGGFSEQELTGATIVFDSVAHLREHLSMTHPRGHGPIARPDATQTPHVAAAAASRSAQPTDERV